MHTYEIVKTEKGFVARYAGNWLGLSGLGPTEAEAIYQLKLAHARLKLRGLQPLRLLDGTP